MIAPERSSYFPLTGKQNERRREGDTEKKVVLEMCACVCTNVCACVCERWRRRDVYIKCVTIKLCICSYL